MRVVVTQAAGSLAGSLGDRVPTVDIVTLVRKIDDLSKQLGQGTSANNFRDSFVCDCWQQFGYLCYATSSK